MYLQINFSFHHILYFQSKVIFVWKGQQNKQRKMLKKFMKNKPNINLNNLESLRLKHKSVRYAIKDAEKLVGSPGKYFNIRNELMSSFSNISGKRNDFAIENPLFKGIL